MSDNTYSQNHAAYFQQLADWQPASTNHPRLYQKSMKNLTGSMQESNTSARIRSFLHRCDLRLVEPIPDYHDYHAIRHQAMNQAQELAFAYHLTHRKVFADRSRAILKQMLEWPDWVYTEHKPRQVDLGVATVARCLALCYDFLYAQLPAKERRQIEQAVIQRALMPFNRVYAEKSEDWTVVKHNWRSVICGKMGIAALIFWEKWPGAREALRNGLDGVADVLDAGDALGGWEEGVHYWGYGIGEAIFFIEALYQQSDGQVSLYDSPFLSNTGNFGLHMRTPAGGCFNFSDCEEHAPLPWLMALLADRYHNTHWQWSAGQDIGDQWPDLLFYNPGLKSQPPDTMMSGFCFPNPGVAALRSSWQPDALFLGLKSGRPLASHGHLDLNSFVLHAFGRPLLVDAETWPYAHHLGFFDFVEQRWDFESNHTLGHNTLLVEGQGQDSEPYTRGRILSFQAAPDIQTAVLAADSAYSGLVTRFRRYFTVLAGKSVLVVDDIEATGLRKLEWLANYQEQAEELPDGMLQVKNDSVYLAIDFLRPAVTEARVVTFSRSVTGYSATYQNTGQSHAWLSVRPLHRQKHYRFIAVLTPYRDAKPGYTAQVLAESADQLSLAVVMAERVFRIEFDFTAGRIQVE